MAEHPPTEQKDNIDDARADQPDHPGRRSKLIPEHLVNFLELLRQNGNVSLSSRMIGWSRSTVYTFANQNAEFKEAMRDAVNEGRELLVGEAWKRATTWTTFKPEGSKETHIKPPSDRLLGLLIQGYFQEFKAQRQEDRPGVDDLLPDTADLTKLSDPELETLEALLVKVGADRFASTGES